MRLSLVCVYAAAALAATTTSAVRTTAPPPTKSTDASGSAGTDTDTDTSSSADNNSSGAGTVRPPTADDEDDTESEDNGPMPALPSPLDALKYKRFQREWHMGPVRMVHARVQSDDPALVDGRFVSSFGGDDLEKGYLLAMDNVNTASVEGALMYVQAEGINVNARAKEERCKRKHNMRNIVFYDIVLVQPNEAIAEYSSTWQQARDTFEYGPMVPMDGGKCTPEMASGSKESLPKACLQFNGEGNEPNLGPFIGGYIKDDDVRAPYPNTYWYSFPNTCPTKTWAQKTDKCRKATRNGLCDLGVGPDGVTCTFAYDTLGWIPIDDVVGITSIKNKATDEMYRNFTEWCEASTRNNEFVGDVKTGKMKSGLKFWQDPLDKGENALRAQHVVDLYNQLVSGDFVSTLIHPKLVKSFKPLPEIDSLRAANPPCYTTVPACNSNYGCRREGYAQLCKVCASKLKGCIMDEGYEYPKLAKAPRYDDIVESESSSDSGSDGSDDTFDDDTDIESPMYEDDAENKTKAPIAQSAAMLPAAALATPVAAALAFLIHM